MALALACLGLGGCGGGALPTPAAAPPPGSVIVHGGGDAALYPIYEELGSRLDGPRLTLEYQMTALPQALDGLRTAGLAFLAADGAPAAGSLPRVEGSEAVAVPVAIAPVAVIYRLPGLRRLLRLDAATLADIYLGRVRRWNDREIARENPGVALPALGILVVHRSDASAVTAAFTAYLTASSRRWRRQVGSGSAVRWPGGTPAPDDATVQAQVEGNPGAIGYTDGLSTLSGPVATATLRDRAGAYVAPTLPAATLAGAAGDGRLVDAPVPGAYPIAVESSILVYRDLCLVGLTARQAQATQGVLRYTLGPGQRVIAGLGLAPLPARLRARALAAVGSLECQAGPIAAA